MDVKEKVIQIIENVSGLYDNININTEIISLGFDELDKLECEIQFEKEFNLKQVACENIFDGCKNIGELVDKIKMICK